MAIYKFRVTFEDYEDVYRDIEVQSDMTLSDLHYAILNSISFDSIHKGMFYESDHGGRKGPEIINISPDETKGSAHKKELADLVYDPRQRFIYIYDENERWSFSVELIKILPDEDSFSMARCVNKVGIAPKQYKEPPLKFKSTDEPDGRKNRKKKEVKKEESAILDDDDDDDEPIAAIVEDDEDDEPDDDAYVHEGEEFVEEEEDLKSDVFKDEDEVEADDDDDDFAADDDDFGPAAIADDDDF